MAKQVLTHATAGCFTCGATVDARNAVAWAHQHVNRHPTHTVELSLGYSVKMGTSSGAASTPKML